MTELKIPDDLKPYLVSGEMEWLDSPMARYHYIFKFDNNYGASIVKGYGTYGYEADKWELATIYFDGEYYKLTYDNPVSNGDVVGWLSNNDVVDYLYMIKDFTEESLADYVAYRDMEE